MIASFKYIIKAIVRKFDTEFDLVFYFRDILNQIQLLWSKITYMKKQNNK